MPDENELALEQARNEAAALMQDMVLESSDVQDFLDNLVKVSAEAFTGAHGEVFCGVTLLRPRSMITIAGSSDQARQMDEVQYGFDDGPCLRAAREGYTVHIPDFLTETRFPEYRTAIAGYGVRSALGIPILLEDGASAGLDFYSTKPDAFSAKSIAVAEGFAREASKSLRLAIRIAKLSDNAANLHAAMESRTVIDLAVGIIMAQNRCSQKKAIAILRSASSAENLKLRDIAGRVVTSVDAESPPQTHFDY
ncbi:GAF and ANTAR domain-containing protein [Arthrobacter sp. H41]|uniref:GAF and ANTAR domain-containing protein n=1 Tax=Arthrobacter sp. H41 TaxID=1312978 RepID=UPI0004BB9B70|nr:GAF and ANTAR domain-containing protein [Arthrobacter sp. H41]